MDSAPSRDGPRVNAQINVPTVRMIDENGEMVGVLPIREALSRAADAGLDLVEISPTAVPPVCRIIEVKEIKLRPNIDEHDYEVKMRAVHRFLEEGDKVKVTMRFRGREMVHQEIGLKVLERVRDELEEKAKVEQMPRLEGRQMIMVLAPK